MNTRKILFGILTFSVLIFASCTSDSADVELYETGIDKSKITKGPDSIDKSKITKGTDAIDKSKITKNNKKR
ncbi:hypothetical protein ACT6NV_14135 [Robiginitalea sp. IMCC44478]|uniref:hypothetical protein n=1 Tax=Robiginitalea sp. IMCC44478 TaxID=3459122 RepID=UPI004041D267